MLRPLLSVRSWLASERSFHAKMIASAIAGAVMMVLLALVFLAARKRELASDQLRDDSARILRLADRAEVDLDGMTLALRDFFATGSPDDLALQKIRQGSLESRLGQLCSTFAENSTQRARADAAYQGLLEWQQHFAEPWIAARLQGNFSVQNQERAQGAAVLARIRSFLPEIAQEQMRYRDERLGRHSLRKNSLTWGFGILIGAAFLFFLTSSIYSYLAFQRHLRSAQDAEERLRVIVDNTPDGLLTADAGGMIVLANPASERLFGVPGAEIAGRHISELLPHRVFTEPLEKLVGATVEVDARRLAAPHDGYPAEISISGMDSASGRLFVALVRDTTERRKNEETLRQIGMGVGAATGEEFVRDLAMRLSQALEVDCAFIVEAEGHGTDTVHVMTMAEKGAICGEGPCDLAGTACEVALREGFTAYLERVQEHFPCDWLVAAFAAEGLVCMPLVAHSGEYVGLLGVLDRSPIQRVDLIEATLQIFAARAAAEVERKRFERDLAREKERLAVTLASIGDGCIALDPAGRIVHFNPAAAAFTGWPVENAMGASLKAVFRPLNVHRRRPLDRELDALLATNCEQDLSEPVIVVSAEGVERIVEVTASPLTGQGGDKIGTVLILRDVTERHRVMEERLKAEKLESLGVAAGGIAHDFNNLLTAILGNLSLVLGTAKLKEPVRERLASAKRASTRAQELATQLLTFAKGGAPIKQAASIAQMLKDTVTFHLRGSNVAIDFHVPENLWAVEVDAGQISQVIQNLTINADQAMPNGGTLRVSCSNLELHNPTQRLGLPAGRFIKISVQDEGTGISEENLKKIFDPYFTTKARGSGLGLATSYSIVKSHGGVIDVVSHIGEGTTFYLFLPATDKPVSTMPETPASDALAQPTPAAGAGRILVLDDEEAICALVTCVLEPMGYEVVEALDAATAVRLYKEALADKRRFDLVISDLTIPGGMGGEEAVRRMRELDPTVRAIVSSGYAMDPVMSKFQDHGFCAMIAKPYEVPALIKTVSEAMAAAPGERVIKHDFAAA